MKKITMICMAALLIFAASCKKEKNEQINENGGDGLGFNVKTEVHSGDSKTYLFNRQVLWNTDDQIKVYNTNGDNAVFTYVKLVEEGDGTTAEFNSNDVTASFFKPNYRGYYPTNFDPTNYTLSQHQTYTTINIDGVNYPTFAKGANPMMATNEPEKYLHFKNVLGILQLQFYSAPTDNVKVKEIRVRSNKLSQKLWGTGSVNANGEFAVTSGGSNTVILDCLAANVTLSHDASNPTSFFILLPPNTLNDGLEVDVVDSDGEFWITKTTNNNIINRSRIRKMPALSVKTCTSEDVQLWAVADANDHNKAPYWATKNLGATSPEKYGDYYSWGVTPSTIGLGGIATLYDSENQPAQTGTSTISVNFRTGLPSTTTGGYGYNKNCPFWYSGNGNSAKWTKYTRSGTHSSTGSADGKTQLETADDIAYQLTGGDYRMPNDSDFNNLMTYADVSSFTTYRGNKGYKYIGKDDYDDRFIFIPAAGCSGEYLNHYTDYYRLKIYDRGSVVYLWSSNLDTNESNSTNGSCFSDMSGYGYPVIYPEYCSRWFGIPVRPIRDNN